MVATDALPMAEAEAKERMLAGKRAEDPRAQMPGGSGHTTHAQRAMMAVDAMRAAGVKIPGSESATPESARERRAREHRARDDVARMFAWRPTRSPWPKPKRANGRNAHGLGGTNATK